VFGGPDVDFVEIQITTTVTVHDYRSLLAAWKRFGGPRSLVGRYIYVGKPLTESQLRRLPAGLRDKIRYPEDPLDFLERMFALEDPRG
jgi:hypothetical protein